MRSLIVVGLTLTVIATVGCSGSDDADPTIPTDATVASTTASTPDPTDPPTSPPTTPPDTASTSAVPTTSVDPTEALIADIEADLNAGEQALFEAGRSPADPASFDLVRRYFSGDSLASIETTLQDLADNGFVVRPNPDIANHIVVNTLEAGFEPDRATVQVCRIDAAVIVEMLPNGSEAIVNDSVDVYQSRSVVVLKDGVWGFESGTPLADAPEVTSCD